MNRPSPTLGEALTACATLTLLVLVLIPMFSQAGICPRPVPRSSMCQSNIRQIWVTIWSRALDVSDDAQHVDTQGGLTSTLPKNARVGAQRTSWRFALCLLYTVSVML